MSEDLKAIWSELQLSELLGPLESSGKATDGLLVHRNAGGLSPAMSSSKTALKVSMGHTKTWQKPSYAVLKDRYESQPHEPSFLHAGSLDRLADPIRGRYSSFDKLMKEGPAESSSPNNVAAACSSSSSRSPHKKTGGAGGGFFLTAAGSDEEGELAGFPVGYANARAVARGGGAKARGVAAGGAGGAVGGVSKVRRRLDDARKGNANSKAPPVRGVLAGANNNKREAAQFKGGGRKGGGGGGAGLFGSSNRTKARARYNNLDASKLSELGISKGVGAKKIISSRPFADALNASNLSQGALRAKDLARKTVMQAQQGNNNINNNKNNSSKNKYLRSRSAYPAGGKVDPLVSSHRAAGLVAASARRGSGGSKSAPSLLSGLERIAPRDFAKKATEARPRYGGAAAAEGIGGAGGCGTRKVDTSLSPRKPPCPSPRSSNKTRNVSSSQSPLKKTVAPPITMAAPAPALALAIRKNSIPFGRSAKSSSNNGSNNNKAGSNSVFDAMLKEEMASNAKMAKGVPTKEAAEVLLVMESIQAREAARAKENKLLGEKKAGKAAAAAVEQSGASQLAALARRLGNRFDEAKTLAAQYKADGLE